MDSVLDLYPDRGAAGGTIAAEGLFAILRTRLGCVDMGWRDETAWVWVTPNGVPFQVAEPDSTGCAGLGSPARELCFSYEYARELVSRIREIMRR
jgi:hypothetical protein